MSECYRWAWFALAVVALAGFAYGARRQYYGCDTEYCVVVNRWTGKVGIEPNIVAIRQLQRSHGAAAVDSFVSAVR
jgi:hypothetical protein